MIRSLEVKGLNNRDDGDFSFHFHEDLNIFTGANGSGKTTLLKLIWYLISGHLKQILSEIPFTYLSIETEPFSIVMDWQNPERLILEFEYSSNTYSEGDGISIKIDAETNTIEHEQKNIDNVNKFEKRIAESSNGSLFFPTFRRIEGGFSRVATDSDNSAIIFRASASEMLQDSMSRFSDEVSINGHKFIASISTEDLRELLTQKYADIYEKITRRQAQVLEEIAKKIQNNPDKNKVSEIPQDPSTVLDAIQKVNEERERLSKPFSVLSELSRKILRYDAIRVTGRVVRGEATGGITLGEGGDGIAVGEAEETKDAISSDKLSSGEKQMLSFLCYNAFSKDTAIFIDEPELSLHVDWERIFLPTLLNQSTGNQFFIATHSPFIFTGYQHKEIPLKSD